MPQPIAWGMNCGTGPDGLLGPVEKAVRLTTLPLIVQPNAGLPREVENRRIYFCTPEYLTSYAKRYVSLGASAVGGCCGTTPEHISELARGPSGMLIAWTPWACRALLLAIVSPRS